MEFKYSLKRTYPEWTKTIKIEDEKSFEKLNLQQIIDKIILTVEQNENDEIVKFELTGK